MMHRVETLICCALLMAGLAGSQTGMAQPHPPDHQPPHGAGHSGLPGHEQHFQQLTTGMSAAEKQFLQNKLAKMSAADRKKLFDKLTKLSAAERRKTVQQMM